MAGCTPRAYRDHCKRVFKLLAQPQAQVLDNPDPSKLPLSADCIRSALEGPFKGNKSSGPSPLLSQLLKHLHVRNNQAISTLFHNVTISALPSQWNTTWLTTVFKKGDKLLASNYRPISIMGPFAKLYATCLN